MGLIVDTTLFVESEHISGAISGLKSSGALRRTGESQFATSTITFTELTYGHWRSGYSMDQRKRDRILSEIRDNFAGYPIDERIAVRAGRLNYVLQNRGVIIGLADLLIAATALNYGYGVLTHNVKHFEWVPDLLVVDAGQ